MVRLTQLVKRAGCAAKHPPGYLFPLLAGLPKVVDPNVLVGAATADDAALYRIDETRALVLTTDFFTPIVDDPYEFGQIAAANALSDVYAMGGRPLTALNIVGFPEAGLEPQVLAEILRGGADKAREAGIDIVGGHTLKTDEPTYGLAVTGIVDIARAIKNSGGKPGDLLVLTKPLGLGVIATAFKRDLDRLGAMREAISIMTHLNDGAMRAMQAITPGSVHAATDVTGFGLLGHLRSLVAASGCSARIDARAVPILESARTYASEGLVPGGTHANARFLADFVTYDDAVDPATQLLLCDAQTSGGLLIACDPARVEELTSALAAEKTITAAVVGALDAPGALGGSAPARMHVT